MFLGESQTGEGAESQTLYAASGLYDHVMYLFIYYHYW